MQALRWANLVFAAWALLGPAAHVMEMPSKLSLDGPLWLAVQQHLYRGWGPLIGAPGELGALAATAALLPLRWRRGPRNATLLAAAAYLGMLTVFFVCNAPVNAAVNRWTAATLPADWPAWRLQWEIGHAIAAALAVIGLVCVVRAFLAEYGRR